MADPSQIASTKKCDYCGAENSIDGINCHKCGTEEFVGAPKIPFKFNRVNGWLIHGVGWLIYIPGLLCIISEYAWFFPLSLIILTIGTLTYFYSKQQSEHWRSKIVRLYFLPYIVGTTFLVLLILFAATTEILRKLFHTQTG
jgi:hypothetical protein